MNLLIQNKKVKFNYLIIETLEAGIKLRGLEVKAIIKKNISIDEAWVRIFNNNVILVGANITPIKVAFWENYKPTRDRTLLIKKTQIRKLKEYLKKGLTIVPTKFYFNSKNLIKVEIAVVKGKKLHDKRKTIMEREYKRYGN